MDRGGPVIPIFILEKDSGGVGASRWWLDRSLESLRRELLAKGSRLIIRRGDTLAVLVKLIRETGAGAILWDKSFEPAQRTEDETIRKKMVRSGIFCDALNDSLLFDPARVLNKQGTPYKVFTPYWNYCLSLEEPLAPLKMPASLSSPSSWPYSEKLEALALKSRGPWAAKMGSFWDPGSRGASAALRKFLRQSIEDYPAGRDCPSVDGTSKLSPHLHFGEISVRKVWDETRKYTASVRRPGVMRASEAFLRQIVWREFAHYLLFHFPKTASSPLRKEYSKFPWKNNARLFRAWQRGETGYPLVDAGMRQLRTTGWMHNRVRMIAASFLVKDLLQPWQAGAAWFMETLVDADLANNTFGWQWVAGCGADAAPYFRIFNPVLQGEKFDSRGDYVRRWVPELVRVPARFIYSPWLASPEVLANGGVRLGKDYSDPVVDHDVARKRALFAYDRMGKQRGSKHTG